MPFVKYPGLRGKVYVPEDHPDAPKKNPCPDCFHCQMCSDDRCHVCLKRADGTGDCHCEDNAENAGKHEDENIQKNDPDSGTG